MVKIKLSWKAKVFSLVPRKTRRPCYSLLEHTKRIMAEQLEELEQHLEMFIEKSRQLGIIASDFQPQGQTALNDKIKSLVEEMQEIDRRKECVQDIQIPIGVFDYIDKGKNPQLYTKDSMEKALQKNEEVKGKSESLNRFRGLLMVELSKTFDNEMKRYRSQRDPDRPQ